MNAIWTALRWLWTPYSFLWLLVAKACGWNRSITADGRVIVEVDSILGFKNTIGQAVGMVVLIRRGHWSNWRLLAHELEHTRQALRWGPIWPLVYFGAIAYTRVFGGVPDWESAYWFSRYERLARKTEWT